MTTDGNFLSKKYNKIKIPSITTAIQALSVISSPTFSAPSIYYNSKKIFLINQGTNVVYEGSRLSPLNLAFHKNSQIGGQSDFISVYYTDLIGDYYYAYGTKDDLGGYASAKIYRAHTDTPTNWADTGASLDTGSVDALVYSDANGIFVIGGTGTGNTVLDSIDTATLASPTTFTTSVNTLPAARVYGMLAVVGTDLYLYGGTADGTTSENTIYTSTTADPTTWTDTLDTLPIPIHSAAVYVDSSYVWLFGGNDSTGAGQLNTIYRAPIATPTVFTSVGTLPYAVDGAKVFVSGTNLYLIGSSISGSGAQKAALSDLTTWTSANTVLSQSSANGMLILDDDNVYILGGANSSGTAVNVIQSATKENPVEFTNEVNTLPDALVGGEVIKTSSYYYIIGGNGITGDVYRAGLADPTTWTKLAGVGPTRTFGKTVIVEDQVWYLGGENAGTPSTSCFRATIQDGAIVGWLENPASAYLAFALPLALSRFALIEAGDYVYIIGGRTTAAMNYNIYRVQKNRFAGSSGFTTWVNVGAINNPMVESSVAIINNTAYIIGGGPNTSLNSSDDYVLSANMTDLANGKASFNEENTSTYAKSGACSTVIDNVLYLYGGRLTSNGTTNIARNMGYSSHTLVSPLVPESITSLPTIDEKTGALGSYSSFQRTGILPWLISDK